MSKTLVFIFSLLVSFSLHAMSVVDDDGQEFVFDKPYQRIISLAPHITELLFDAGAGQQLVGAMAFSDFPEAAKKITRIGNHDKLNYEKIISLQPDLIIGWKSGNNSEMISRLNGLGFKVFLTNPHNISDIPGLLRRFGTLTGQSEAELKAKNFEQRLAKLQQDYHGKTVVSVFYQIWHDPMMTLNGKHMVSSIIELCGGSNIFHDALAIAPKVSVESIIALNPQAIIVAGKEQDREGRLGIWQSWQHISAVENKQLYMIPADLLNRHSARVIKGAEIMCQQLEKARQFYR